MRVFVAVELSAGLREALRVVISRLSRIPADIRWADPKSIHLTLKFLGEVDEEESLPLIEECLAETAGRHTRFELVLRGTGTFPESGLPRVMWAGFVFSPELARLQTDLESGLAGLDFPADERPFTPHLTLGRVKGPRGVREAWEALTKWKDAELGRLAIERVILFESVLKPQGAEYRHVKEFGLK